MTDSYRALAPYYDTVYSGRDEEIEIIHGLVDKLKPAPQRMLDLGTGTGTILATFDGKINELVGVDTSPSMLEIARQTLPTAEFVEADMAQYDDGRPFDVVTCLSNEINHLERFDEWEKLFVNTSKLLRPGGIFIFDTVTTGVMDRLACNPSAGRWKISGGRYSFEVHREDENKYTAAYTVKREVENKPTEVATGKLEQTVFPLEKVRAMAGKNLVHLFEMDHANRGVVSEPLSDDAVRPLFMYGKPYKK